VQHLDEAQRLRTIFRFVDNLEIGIGSEQCRRPERTTAWSSAIRMRIGTWHLHHDGGTCPRPRFPASGSAQRLGSLPQPEETQVLPALDLVRFEPDAVVLDHHKDPVAATLRHHVDPGRSGVAHDVGHRLLDHAVESRLHRHRRRSLVNPRALKRTARPNLDRPTASTL